jgi:tetratricopeptide (TPR) repeat protein
MKRFDEALAEIKRALALDPMSVIMNRIYADIFMDMRRFDEALKQYQKTLELDPTFPTTLYFLGRAYEAKGMYDQAVAQYAIAGERTGLPREVLADANQVYATSGWKPYLERSLEHILAQPPSRRFPPFVIATQYARLGRKEEALSWLQQAYEERDFRVRHVSVMFEFDDLRSDPRFVALVQKLGLPL